MNLTENDWVDIVCLFQKEITDTEQRLWYTEHTELSQKYLESHLREMNDLKKKVIKGLKKQKQEN